MPDLPVIVVDHLSKIYRVQKKAPGLLASIRGLVRRTHLDVRAVDDVSFTIGKGELIGFLGPNGAGKTTTLKVLAGLFHPTSGHAWVPSDVFRGPARPLLTYAIPIALIATLPAKALLGVIEPGMAPYQVGLTAALLWASHRFWTYSLKRYSSASS